MERLCVTIDCHEPEKLAGFWNETLAWGGVAVADDGGGAACWPHDGGVYLGFVRVPEDKVVKNRVHLGLDAGSLEDRGAARPRGKRVLPVGRGTMAP